MAIFRVGINYTLTLGGEWGSAKTIKPVYWKEQSHRRKPAPPL